MTFTIKETLISCLYIVRIFDIFTGTNSSSFICQTRTTEVSVVSTTTTSAETKTETDTAGMSEGAKGDVDLYYLPHPKWSRFKLRRFS